MQPSCASSCRGGLSSYARVNAGGAPSIPANAPDAARNGPRAVHPTMSAMTGLFVVFEGGDGAGKTTQARLLADWAREAGREVVLTREPGEGPVGERIRAILLDPATGDLSPRAEALLYSADRAHHVDTVIRPALERGALVICDRYIDSTLAYQGAGRVLDLADLEPIAWWAADHLVPDLTVLLDLPPAQGLATIAEHDRLEAAGEEFHTRTRHHFVELAAREPERYLVLAAREPVDALAATIRGRVEELSEPGGRMVP